MSASAHTAQNNGFAAAVDPMAGLLHEIDTPLGVALTAASMQGPALQLLAEHLALLPAGSRPDAALQTLRESMRLVHSAIDRAVAIVGGHKSRRRSGAAPGEALDLGTILADALQVPLARYGERVIECNLEAEADLLVHTEPNAWYQVITNLVANSVLHGFVGREDGGRLEISAWQPEPGRVRVLYRDDGCGMSAHARAQAFVRSYTSRRGGGSSGLGLCIMADIVRERLHGRIELLPAEAGPTPGCAFAIDFPAHPPQTA
jgi:signal transduction histidine kinase